MNESKDIKLNESEENDGISFEPLDKDTEIKETKTREESQEKQIGEKKKKAVYIAITVLAVVFLVAAGIYIGVAIHYKSHFLPNTSINLIDCSEMDAAQVAGLLENKLQEYSLEITGRDNLTAESGAVIGRLTAADIALTYAGNARFYVDELLRQQNAFSWPYRFLSNNSFSTSLVQGVSYDDSLLSALINSWEACREKNMITPENAYISEYSEKLKGYEIIPETIGTRFQVEQVHELIAASIIAQEPALDIEDAGCYEEASITSQDEKLTKALTDANRMLETKITYDWNGTEVLLDGELIKGWLSIVNNRAVLDEDAVAEFVKEQSEKYDTYGRPRNFMTTLGIELTLPSGYYGWLTDRPTETEELVKLIQEGSVETREPVYSSTARKKGMSDIGTSYVEADLTHQHLYLYQDGQLVFETNFVSGNMISDPGCVTPQGVFGLAYKTTNAVLRGANYETPVNYWMPFYGNYGMHDATWRSEFGGDIYIANGSHGCLNLPLESAAVIYQYVSTGFPIICYYYPVDPLAAQPEDNVNLDDSDDSEE